MQSLQPPSPQDVHRSTEVTAAEICRFDYSYDFKYVYMSINWSQRLLHRSGKRHVSAEHRVRSSKIV